MTKTRRPDATAAFNRIYLSKLEEDASFPGLEIIAKLFTVPEVALAGRC